MPSIKTALKAIVGRTVATEHATLLAAITDREQRLREVPAIRRRLGDRREEIRARESQLAKKGAELRGYEGDPLRWSVKASEARDQMASIRREIAAMSDEIAADEKTLSEIAAATLPPVGTDLLRFHNEQVEQAQASVSKIQNALESARGELSALEATPGPAAELRLALSEALAGQALGTATQAEVEAIEGQLSQAETVTTTTGAKARRIEATITGLEQRLSLAQADLDRLTSATPTLQAEFIAPEVRQAESAYTRSLAATVEAFDQYRALRHLHSAIRPDVAFPPLPEAIASLKDPGQLRLAQAIEREQERLSALGI